MQDALTRGPLSGTHRICLPDSERVGLFETALTR